MLESVSVPISVLVVDDHDALRATIINTLHNEMEINVVGEAKDGYEALEQVNALMPDVVIMGIAMPFLDGITAAERITAGARPAKVIIISHDEEEECIHNCMKAGASSYIMKDALASELVKAIHVAHNGGHFFSPRIAKRIVGFYLKQVASIE